MMEGEQQLTGLSTIQTPHSTTGMKQHCFYNPKVFFQPSYGSVAPCLSNPPYAVSGETQGGNRRNCSQELYVDLCSLVSRKHNNTPYRSHH